MDWLQAKETIKSEVRVGTDLNTPKSNYRFVKATESPITSTRYAYKGETGFRVPIGRTTIIPIPWIMLRKCFRALATPNGYDGNYFRDLFPIQADDHPCYVHVVGQIYVAAGIATTDGTTYWLRSSAKT